MKRQNSFAAYILIGIGVYFLLRELRIPIITDFYSWPTFLIIIGLALLIHSYTSKDYQHLFSGTIVLGLGIHFHGIEYYQFWIDHWAVYPMIVGIAFIVRALRTKKGFATGLILTGLSILFMFSIRLPSAFNWIYELTAFLEKFWPVILIGIGIYWLKKKK
ncbi:LiaI-LiaF-like domain-containing protein [Virgibacillus sp. JSM 102003]|uniref:LiaI-LiaF-like domain-containing protein n=1 Tax=Virgibacillus sp. JSM 102003 TaxID=1562108 RepID=UPI0035C089BD